MIDNNYPRIPLLNDNKQIKLYNEVLIKRYKVCKARMMRHGAAWWCLHYNERTASSFMRVQCTRNNGADAEWHTNMGDSAYAQVDVRRRLKTQLCDVTPVIARNASLAQWELRLVRWGRISARLRASRDE